MGIISDASPYSLFGLGATAFFVSQDGKMITNRHVTAPWKLDNNETARIKADIKRIMKKMQDESVDDYLSNSSKTFVVHAMRELERKGLDPKVLEEYFGVYLKCAVEDGDISGELDYIAVGYPYRCYSNIDEFERCTAIAEAEDENVDIALLQLNSGATPPTVKRTFDLNKSVLDPKKIVPLKHRYYYIGYPAGILLNLREDGLKPQFKEVLVSRTPERYTIDLQGEVIGGASGSPVVDQKGRLIGVISSHYTLGSTMGRCERIRYAKELYDDIEVR